MPDVVVIVIDTLRPDHLGLYGYPHETAPFLKELAATSTVFRRAYSTSSWTAPATASLFTSKYPTQHGVTKGFFATRALQQQVAASGSARHAVNAIEPSLATLPELFQTAGYRTYGVAANVNLGDAMGFTRGFDRFEQLHELQMGSAGSARDIEAKLADWQEEIGAAEPAFVYLHFNDVHNPYVRHQPWYEPSPDPVDDARAAYDSEIRAVDESLRRIMDRFGWLDESSHTVLAVVSDHGEEFQEHGGRFHKLSLYRELMQVVTILRLPAGRGQEVDLNVSLVDILPTLLDLAGLPPTEDAEGRSLANLVTGEATADEVRRFEERSLYAHRRGARDGDDRTLQAVVEGDLHLIQSDSGVEIFNLVDDPRERHDLAAENLEEVERLLMRLRAFEALSRGSESAQSDVEIDSGALEELRSLGYIE